MTNELDWLPPRLEFANYNGNWFKYLDDLYLVYMRTLVWDRATFQQKTVLTDSNTIRDEKEETFWHIIEGKSEGKIQADFDRCASVPWIRAIIDESERRGLKVWFSIKGSKKRGVQLRYYIALNDFSFLVALHSKTKMHILLTAFPIVHENYKRKLKSEYDAWRKTAENSRSRP